MIRLKLPRISQVVAESRLVTPADPTLADLKQENASLIVVSIFGTSQFVTRQHGPAYKRAFQLAIDAFGNLKLFSKNKENCPEGDKDKESSADCVITGFYNELDSVLILNLDGAFDPNICLDACQSLNSTGGFTGTWSRLNSSYSQSLLLLFSLSHIMILSSVGSYFDTSYIHLFRALDMFRKEAKPFIVSLLDEIEGLPRHWAEHGRLCSPRLLFVFEVESVPNNKLYIGNAEGNRMKELQHKLETEIYNILRKCRIITNISGQSLFAISVTQDDYIFLYDKDVSDGGCENNAFTFNHFIQQFCSHTNKGQSYGGSQQSTPSASPSTSKTMLMTPKIQQEMTHGDFVTGFRSFLLKQIKLGLVKGFEDNFSQVAEYKHFFVLPTWKEWKLAYDKISGYLIRRQHSEPEAIKVLDDLTQYLNVDLEYLENQCSKMFPKVFAVYTKNTAEYYSAQEHRTRLGQAINMFLTISRGPAMLPWLDKLTEKCYNYWKRDHEQCERRSLHEHCCTNRLHRVTLENHLEVLPFPVMDESLPEMKHTTGNRLTSYCNCGRRQGNRDEPFTIREANYSFYQRLARDCCEKLERWPVPIFIPPAESTQGVGLTLQEMLLIIQNKGKKPAGDSTDGDVQIIEEIEEEEDLLASQAMERECRQGNEEDEEEEDDGQPEGEDLSTAEDVEAVKDQSSSEIVTDADADDAGDSVYRNSLEDSLLLSQEEVPERLPTVIWNSKHVALLEEVEDKDPSMDTAILSASAAEATVTVTPSKPVTPVPAAMEYLPGMIHSKSPPELLPLFPSWSLVRLGPSNIYAHTSGMQYQPGFLAGSNYLLPLDVTVKAEAGVSKPVPRLIRGRPASREAKRISDEFSVKVFIGFEYECKKGHRFMIESSEKVLSFHVNRDREFNPPNMRDAAAKVAASDLHLYFRCPCNTVSSSEVIAQLMRIHVVTPKAPVHVTLNPRVQPGPPPCPLFTPGNSERIKLSPSTYWVLRLPYSYVSEDQVYVPPNNIDSYNGKLLHGLIQVICMSTEETQVWEKQNSATL